MRNIHGVILSSVLVVTALTACDPAGKPEAAAPPAGAASAPAGATTAASSAPAGLDGTTKEACDQVIKAINDNTKKVASAEKIGPPVGYVAVSTQYIAGSTAVTAYSIGANDTVSAAAKKVADAMDGLDKAWNANPKKAPSKAELDAAIKEFKAACAG